MWLDVFNATRTARTAGCWRPSRASEAVVVDPGFEPEAVARDAGGGGQDARSPCCDARAPRPRGRGRGVRRRRRARLHPRGRRRGVHRRPGLAAPDSTTRSRPSKDLRTIADGDVLRLAGLRDRGAAHARAHARALRFRVDADVAALLGRPGVRGLDRTLGLPELRSRRRCRRACAGSSTLPDELPVLPGHGPETTVGRERATNPFLRALLGRDGARAAARARRTCSARRADAMLGLYEEAHRIARLLRVPIRRDADLRAHRAVRADVGRDVRRRDEGDVHVRGQGRPLAHAAARGHRGRGARLPRRTRTTCRARSRATTSTPSSATGDRRRAAMREFRQFGVEVIGTRAPGADVEVIALGDRFLRDRGLIDVRCT